jgi:hypothetical protein
MANPNHDEKGRFASGSASGAASGDHLATQPANPALRNVSGRTVPRSKPVARHANVPSVGTDAGSGPRLSDAARANIIRGKAIDARHYGVANDTGGERLRSDTGPKTDFGKPMSGFQSKPGTFQVRARVKQH